MPLNPDHETRFARRSSAHWPPLCLGHASSSSAPSRDPLQSPETRRKTRSWPRAIPECEHRGDWVAEGAVSSEPVSPRFGHVPAEGCIHACAPEHTDEPGRRDGSLTPGADDFRGGPTSQVDRAPRHRARRLAPRDACWRSWCPPEAHVPVVPERSGIPRHNGAHAGVYSHSRHMDFFRSHLGPLVLRRMMSTGSPTALGVTRACILMKMSSVDGISVGCFRHQVLVKRA